MMKNKLGFTLSEMLIAMVIIGVLGIVLAPIITKMMPDQNKVMIKRSYYVITNTVSAMLDDDNLYSPFGAAGSGNETTPIYANKLFDNKDAVTYNGKTYSGNTKFVGIFTDMIGAKDEGTEEDHLAFWRNGSWHLYGKKVAHVAKTKDGVRWMFFDDPDNEAVSIIKVDVNGSKAPNTYQWGLGQSRTTNFDQYFVKVSKDGKVELNQIDKWVQSVIDSTGSVGVE